MGSAARAANYNTYTAEGVLSPDGKKLAWTSTRSRPPCRRAAWTSAATPRFPITGLRAVTRIGLRFSASLMWSVRTVKPELVFELGFEGLQRSKRHKSGVAVRFPRIARWRSDKPASEADSLETLKRMIAAPSPPTEH